MALSGSVNTGSYDGRYYTLSWTATQSVANNTSTISWTLSCSGGESDWYAERTLNCTIAGTTVYSKTDKVNRYAGTITSGTLTVSHDSDGTKTFSVAVNAAVYTSAVNCTASATFTLTTIARASTVSAGTLTMGTAGTITVTRNSSSFTHTITYSFGSYSGTIATKSSSTSISWTPPLTLANAVPSATSGTGTLTCKTYSGSTSVGSSTASFTLKVPSSVVPTVDSGSLTMVNSNSVVDGWGIYVQGYSQVLIEAEASGVYGSTISSYTSVGRNTHTIRGTTFSYTSAALGSGDYSFTITAKDSRGRTSDSYNLGSFYSYAYSAPVLSAFSAERGSSDATAVTVTAVWSYSSVNGNNSATAVLKYKLKSADAWTTYGEIENDSETVLDIAFDEAYGYDFQLTVTDALSNSAAGTASVNTTDVLMDFRAGGKGLGIGKIAESDALEIALPVTLFTDDYEDGVSLEDYIAGMFAYGYVAFSISATSDAQTVASFTASSDYIYIVNIMARGQSNGTGVIRTGVTGQLTSATHVRYDTSPSVYPVYTDTRVVHRSGTTNITISSTTEITVDGRVYLVRMPYGASLDL